MPMWINEQRVRQCVTSQLVLAWSASLPQSIVRSLPPYRCIQRDLLGSPARRLPLPFQRFPPRRCRRDCGRAAPDCVWTLKVAHMHPELHSSRTVHERSPVEGWEQAEGTEPRAARRREPIVCRGHESEQLRTLAAYLTPEVTGSASCSVSNSSAYLFSSFQNT